MSSEGGMAGESYVVPVVLGVREKESDESDEEEYGEEHDGEEEYCVLEEKREGLLQDRGWDPHTMRETGLPVTMRMPAKG